MFYFTCEFVIVPLCPIHTAVSYATVELSRDGVGGVNTIRNWLTTTADGCVHTADTTQLDFAVGQFVQTRRNCRQLVANFVHTADATQLSSKLQLSRVGGVNAPVGSLNPVYNFLCC